MSSADFARGLMRPRRAGPMEGDALSLERNNIASSSSSSALSSPMPRSRGELTRESSSAFERIWGTRESAGEVSEVRISRQGDARHGLCEACSCVR